MPRSLSKSQIDKLGERLRDSPTPVREDLEALASLRQSYAVAMQMVQRALRELGLESTSRPKTIGTMIDKLRRDSRITLSRMQDVAGVRVTMTMTLAEQDAVVERIRARAEINAWRPRLKDRRVEPSAGYRAVHVIVTVDECPVEIQVRTSLQDLWAQAFEDLGEVLGRGIRYGEPPRVPPRLHPTEESARHLVAITQEESSLIAQLEAASGTLEQCRKDLAKIEGLGIKLEDVTSANLKESLAKVGGLQEELAKTEGLYNQLQDGIAARLTLIRKLVSSFKDNVP